MSVGQIASKKVLIVDDNRQFATVLKKTLEGAFGFTSVTCIDNIAEAYQTIEGEPDRFGLLFIDFRFPSGETGGELLEKLAAADLIKGKAAFLITSEPTPENLAQAVAAGALGVLAKPFDRADLARHISNAERRLAMESAESF